MTVVGGSTDHLIVDRLGNVQADAVLEVRTLAGVTVTDVTAPVGWTGQSFPAGKARADGNGYFKFVVPDATGPVQVRTAAHTKGADTFAAGPWLDVSGQIVPGSAVDQALAAMATDADIDAKVAAQAAVDGATFARQVAADLVFKPEAYGAVGDGVADDTAAVRAAFDAATAARRTGLSATILHPGATVVLEGTYALGSLAAPIDVSCNVRGGGAALIAPAAYAGTVLRVGHATSGSILQAADITLPDVIKPASDNPLVAGSVGVQVQNLYNSRLAFGRVAYFETGIHLTGLGNGTVYNTVHMGWVSYAKVAIRLKPGVGGWVNQNTFVGGGVQQSPSFAGGGLRRTGWRHLVLDGAGVNAINGNTFVGVSFEGDVSEYVFELRDAYDNNWLGCRHEQGTAGTDTTVSGATLTSVAHGLSVGGTVAFTASTIPGGMVLEVPYFVTSTPTADTFTVSLKKAGTPITFTSAGTSVRFYRPQRILLDASAGVGCFRNVFDRPAASKPLELVNVGPVDANGVRTARFDARDSLLAEDTPLYRARNRSQTASTRPAFGAYAPTIDPMEDPQGWATALSDRGVLFAAGGAETSRLFASGGILFHRRPADTASYELATCRRSPSFIPVTALSCAANTTTGVTVTLADASVGDHVAVTPAGAMPAGITIAHARVTAADQVTITFGNLTAGAISLTVNVQVIAFRRFY